MHKNNNFYKKVSVISDMQQKHVQILRNGFTLFCAPLNYN